LGDLAIDRRMILKWNLKKLEGMDIDLVWDTDKWQAVVSTVSKHQVVENAGNLFTS
jgi:hypothetical protein